MDLLPKECAHTPVSRPLTREEMQFYAYVQDERFAIALAQVATVRPNASLREIEQVVIAVLNAALEYCGLEDRTEYIGGRRTDRWKEPQ